MAKAAPKHVAKKSVAKAPKPIVESAVAPPQDTVEVVDVPVEWKWHTPEPIAAEEPAAVEIAPEPEAPVVEAQPEPIAAPVDVPADITPKLTRAASDRRRFGVPR